jgi:signal transduction histidine kinase
MFADSLKIIESVLSCTKSDAKQIGPRDQDGPIATAIKEPVTVMNNSLTSIRNTNTFMIMAINRCIDYVKVNKGLKLTPRNETIDLMDALSMPLDCMKNIQEKIEIALQPVPTEICSHIITDKQWLQENILCLLSNAVKYIVSGDVNIRVTKVIRSAADVDKLSKSRVGKVFSISGKVDEGNNTAEELPILKASSNILSSPNRIVPCTSDSSMSSVDCKVRPRVDSGISINSCESIKLITFLRIEVEDHGIGISPEVMASLFNPFTQAQHLAGGTGKYQMIFFFSEYLIFFSLF